MTVSLTQRYRHKIKTVDELVQTIGARPRKEKVIMCHGVFDVVHPGHLRHLLYAKSKAPIIVASVTADIHIGKGQYRPHIPQDLRALNLAALDIVDYVIIDANATPIENIRKIQPDFFAKGYEYNATTGMPARTQEEAETLHAYGGEMIFTPGDIVYSSSAFIEMEAPSLKIEKLLTFMDTDQLGFAELRGCLDKLEGKRVHVVGDTIIDSYTQTAMIGGQSKTPTISVLYEKRDDYIGGAGIVAQHLRAAGAEVVFSTVLGEDALKDFTLEGMGKAGVDCRAIIDPTRPTTNKNAIVAGGYRLLKLDTLDNRSISDDIVQRLTQTIAETPCDAVVFSDFRHGVFNRRTIAPLTAAIPDGAFKVADSQVASRWGNITDFQSFDLITPNEREARFALGDQDTGIRPLSNTLYEVAKCKTLILKLGERGVLTCWNNNDGEGANSFMVLDSFTERLVDAVGAGDALLAYATLTLLATGSPVAATILGAMAAACECECDGNIPVTPDAVRRKIDAAERQAKFEGA